MNPQPAKSERVPSQAIPTRQRAREFIVTSTLSLQKSGTACVDDSCIVHITARLPAGVGLLVTSRNVLVL
ncbi:hypothetical protein PsYK624_103580 [Phanerochaete sordida]|uniref:Uncharacterized protein n=1 Tax=Phanerochaete sordida TaxID=48140 RepID=A0A9P3GFY2_9APHY|nr:hypothetical protein PsYK624_103580 [Phanerochaete sordida]